VVVCEVVPGKDEERSRGVGQYLLEASHVKAEDRWTDRVSLDGLGMM
jgi:hypothetical protein